jgi:protein SCO1/2
MKSSAHRILLFAVAGLLALGLGFYSSSLMHNSSEEFVEDDGPELVPLKGGTALPGQEKPLPAFALTDKNQQPFTNDSFKGHWSYVFFGYTHCPDICPVTLQVMAQTLKKLQPGEAQAVFISVDPQRDTPEKIKQYVEFFHPDMTGATGTPEALKALAGEIGIVYQRLENAEQPENYLIDHSAAILLINPKGELAAVFTPPHLPENLVDDLHLVRQL